MSAAPVRGWAASLILHGLFLAAVLAWVKPAPAPPLRWRVAVVPAAVDPDSPHLSPSPRRSGTPAPPVPLAPGQASAPAPDRTMATPDEALAPAPLADSAAPPATPPSAGTHPPALASPRPPPLPADAPRAAGPVPASVPSVDPGALPALLAARLAALKRYPLAARRLGQEGIVVLEATVLADGQAAARVKQSSGHPHLDKAALRLFESAMASLAGQWTPAAETTLEIPVVYRLEG